MQCMIVNQLFLNHHKTFKRQLAFKDDMRVHIYSAVSTSERHKSFMFIAKFKKIIEKRCNYYATIMFPTVRSQILFIPGRLHQDQVPAVGYVLHLQFQATVVQ